MVENKLFNEKIMDDYIAKYEKELVFNENAVQIWIDKLNNDELKDEVKNYSKFTSYILNDILGYTPEDYIDQESIGDEKRPVDYVLLQNDKKYVAVELKGTSTPDITKRHNRENSAVEQACLYATEQRETKWAIASNYDEFRLFNPKSRNDYISFNFRELEDEKVLKKFLLCFSKFSLIEEDIPQKLLKQSTILERELEDEFYQLFSETRLMLIKELENSSEDIDRHEAIRLAQLILNRYIFICFAEDLGLLPALTSTNTIMTPIENANLRKNTIWNRLNELFFFVNEGNPQKGINEFNGGLFAEELDDFKIRDMVDDLSFFDDCYKKWKFEEQYEKIKPLIENYKDVLNPIYKNLLTISEFDFDSQLDVNILGHIFENSIGDIEELKNENKSRRKKDGVFYTPEYITDYICRNTIIPYLSKSGEINTVEDLISEYNLSTSELEKLDEKLKNIKIVDPACGSGAFLNKAADVLLEIHEHYHAARYAHSKNKLDQWFDSVNSRREILINNIYGVDLNPESVEITKLALFLKVATKGMKLPNLDKNIKCGNSLVDDENIAGDKAFDWKKEFDEVFENDGFDIVVGNPPYVSSQIKNLSENEDKIEKKFLKENYFTSYKSYDLYVVFLEKGIKILRENGILSYIIPNKFLNSAYGDKLKEYLNKYQINELIDFGDNQIFKDAKNYTCIPNITKTSSNKHTLYLKNISNPELTLFDFFNKKENQNSKLISIENAQMKEWKLLDKQELDILNKLKKFSTLHKYSKNIWEGARPGFEKAYIVTEKEIYDLNLEKELIKQFIKNEDINKYSINTHGEFNNSKYIIYPYKNLELVDLDNYPNVKKHLEKFNDNLYDSNGKTNEILRYSYYHLPKEFNENKPLIITPDISKHNSFALLNTNTLFPNTIYSISLDNEFEKYKYVLLAILNSNLVEWFIKKISPTIRGGYHRYKSIYLEQIPIIPLNESLCEEFNEIVINLLNLKNEKINIKNSFIRYLERELEIDLTNLKRKSYIPNCFDMSFLGEKESLFNLIKYNKKIIPINIHSKDFQENLENEFNNSKYNYNNINDEKIINKINELVYKLYDLTEEEISIIEESLK